MADWYSNPNPGLNQEWNKQDVNELRKKLITANHILHYHGIVDAYGHISFRHPQRPNVYIMCGYMAPALVSANADLVEYWVDGSDPVDANAIKGYAERFIHGEIFRHFDQVNVIVHSHAEAVLPYVCSSVPLKPVFHMAGFLGSEVPVFDIADAYEPSDVQDMLVRNARLGTALATRFVGHGSIGVGGLPESNVVLMKRHGYTTWGRDIEAAVYRAIYTKVNANIQTQTISLQRNYFRGDSAEGSDALGVPPFDVMSDKMCEGCAMMNEGTHDKPWKLWVKEVEKVGLYENKDLSSS